MINQKAEKMKPGVLKQFILLLYIILLFAMHVDVSMAMAEEDPSLLINEIQVKGTQRTEPAVVLLRIRTKEGAPLDQRIIREDLHVIMRTGYFQSVSVEASYLAEGIKIVFLVEERPTIREISYEGNKSLDIKDFEKVVDLKPNHFLNVSKLKENVEKIRKLYANEGYFQATINYEIDHKKNKQVAITFKIQEKEEIKIGQINFIGNQIFSDKKLRRVIETKRAGMFSFLTSSGVYKEDILRDDVTRLTLFYLDEGYLQFSAKPPLTLTTQDGMYVFFVIEEGEQYQVRNVRWENAEKEDEEYFLDLQSLRPGDIFSRQKLQKDIMFMTDYYTDRGYAFAEVNPLYLPQEDTLTVEVVYQVKKGKKIFIGDILLKGNSKTRDKVIRREMALKEGELFSGTKLRTSRAEINRLGFFEAVNINTQPNADPDKLDVVIDVQEGQTGTLSGGAGFSSTDQFIFMANIAWNNLMGRAQVLSLNADFGGTRQNFSLSFTEPWLFDIPLSVGFDAFNTKREYQDFTRKSTGGACRFGYEFYEHIRANAMYKYEKVDIPEEDINPMDYTILQEAGESTTSSITFSVIQNSLDNPLAPLEGFLNIASVELAGTKFLGGDNDFAKIQLEAGAYLPLFWNTTVHLRSRLGLGFGLAGDKLPIFERFFVGGISTVRGFDVRSLGPSYIDPYYGTETTIGGNKELIFNLEYVFPIVPQAKLRGLIFFDAGNAFSEDEDINFSSLRLSVGLGFRWFSPMGPLTFVLGFPLDRREGEDPSAIQFSIGTLY